MSNVALWSRPTWTVDHMLRDLFGPAMQVAGANEAFPSGFNPSGRGHQDGEDAVVRLEIPGVDVDRDVKVELDAGRLVISGERRDEHAENTEGRTVREVRYGSFQRSFRRPGPRQRRRHHRVLRRGRAERAGQAPRRLHGAAHRDQQVTAAET